MTLSVTKRLIEKTEGRIVYLEHLFDAEWDEMKLHKVLNSYDCACRELKRLKAKAVEELRSETWAAVRVSGSNAVSAMLLAREERLVRMFNEGEETTHED